MIYYLVAGNRVQATQWASDRKLLTSDWRYVDHPDQLRGINPFKSRVYLIGTYNWRRDLEDIKTECKLRGLPLISGDAQESR